VGENIIETAKRELMEEAIKKRIKILKVQKIPMLTFHQTKQRDCREIADGFLRVFIS